MLLHLDRDLDLRADAVGARRQPAAIGQLVQAGERADARSHLRALGRGDQRLDPLQRPLIRLDVDAGRGVRQSLRAGHYFGMAGSIAPLAGYGSQPLASFVTFPHTRTPVAQDRKHLRPPGG